MNTNLTSNETIQYAVKINGRIVTKPFQNRVLAELEKEKLPQNEQILAEIVSVNSQGLELLLG